ncbi:MAG: hypothetical protein RQ757_06915 [Pseudomonadales bacterium]|nr:hypothetical protein [Pseudomonadales bacterium]
MKIKMVCFFPFVLAGCANQPDNVCLPWSNIDCPDMEPAKYLVTTRYEGVRPDKQSKDGWDRDDILGRLVSPKARIETIAKQHCGELPLPWSPEKPVSVDVLDTTTGVQTTVICKDVI